MSWQIGKSKRDHASWFETLVQSIEFGVINKFSERGIKTDLTCSVNCDIDTLVVFDLTPSCPTFPC